MTKTRYCLERLDTVEYEHLYKFKDAALKELTALETAHAELQAENERLNDECIELQGQRDNYKTANERLKCCGNCGEYWDRCEDVDDYWPWEKCDDWQPRGEHG